MCFADAVLMAEAERFQLPVNNWWALPQQGLTRPHARLGGSPPFAPKRGKGVQAGLRPPGTLTDGHK